MDYYDQIANGYEELHRSEQEKKIKIILADPSLQKVMSSAGLNPDLNSDLNNDLKILDVGCGTGIFFEFINLPIKQKLGIDPSKELIRIAEEKRNGTYSVGHAEELPYEDGEFDVVVSLTAIQNFTDVKRGLDEIRRVGKKDSKFILTFLKKSGKNRLITELIEKGFHVEKMIEEDKDIIYFCKKK